MKKLYIAFILSITSTFLLAQTPSDTSYWKRGGIVKIDFAQNSFTNWAAGGINSMAVNSLLSTFANYKKDNLRWDNTLDLGYGLIRQKPAKDSVNLMKSDDKIDFNSKFGLKAFDSWFYSGFLNFKTQFDKGYRYPDRENVISRFMAPAYLLFGAGMDYKPSDNFTVLISPVTGKGTFVLDDTLNSKGAFGVEPGMTSRMELGGYVKAAYKVNLADNVSMQTKVDLFSNYLKNPQNVDVNWELLVAMKVNKFITATIGTQVIYDDDIKIKIYDDSGMNQIGEGPRTQFKEVFAIGLSYKF